MTESLTLVLLMDVIMHGLRVKAYISFQVSGAQYSGISIIGYM